ncbi:hypothetical protein [Erythrobacter rubeus]|uniref:Uncharacterized protein n=1 Tax=Erythrobacter rubeus TaxID=2760803 RepID=A0ABR8KS32_9SPHN|nr:hypothetical protein [Erythrobacter rubeus]MBD2841878.1 hypothetical protein [Erythrobacter rubeus]
MKRHHLPIIALAPGLVALSACEQPPEDPAGGEFESTEPVVEEQFEVENIPDPNAADPALPSETEPPTAEPEVSEISPEAAEEEMVEDSAQETAEIESEAPE